MEVVFFLEIKTEQEEDREENLTRTHHPNELKQKMFPLFPKHNKKPSSNTVNKTNHTTKTFTQKKVNVDVCRVRKKNITK